MPVHREYDDNYLLLLLRDRNCEAFEVIYERYWKRLFKVSIDFLRDEDAAKDVVQDIFEMLWKNAGQLEVADLYAYLFISLRNKMLNRINREGKYADYLASLENYIDAGVYTTDQAIRERELRTLIMERIEHLPKKMRKVFTLSRFFNYSYKEIAQELNISENTVKKQINNALSSLRSVLHLFVLVLIQFFQ